MRTVPLAPGVPGLGSTPAFYRDPIQLFVDGWRACGDVVRYRFGGRFEAYVFTHPDHVQHILERASIYGRVPLLHGKFKAFLGEGLLTSEGPLWRKQRRLIQPAFHRARLQSLADLVTEAATEGLANWSRLASANATIDASREFLKLTLHIAVRALFGADLGADTERFMRAATLARLHTNARAESYVDLPEWVPSPANRRFLHARAILDNCVYRLIDEAQHGRAAEGGLLQMLVDTRDGETGEPMPVRQLRDECMTLLIAGHETVATALTWTFYLLSLHPEILRRLQREVHAVLDSRTPRYQDLSTLTYTTMVIQESMRLYPPVWSLARQTKTEDTVADYRVPAGSIVGVFPYITHRHPAFWDNPEGFDPERFQTDRSAGRPRFAYFPFGGGPRICIGNSFALMEMQLLIPMIVQRFRLDVVPGFKARLSPKVTLRPANGMPMRLRPIGR